MTNRLPIAVMLSAGSATKDKGLADIKILYINSPLSVSERVCVLCAEFEFASPPLE